MVSRNFPQYRVNSEANKFKLQSLRVLLRKVQSLKMATSSTQATVFFMDKIMKKIFRFYNEQSLIDVTFKVSNPEASVRAHRLILSAASPYFENLFNGDRENISVIEINDIDSDIFEHLITFCYTGKALVTVDNAAAMLKASIVLQLEDAETTCVDFIMAHIDECTLQGVYALEREAQCEILKRKILEYEIQNFMEISQRDEFLNFDVEKLQCLLESDNLNITREEDAYGAITRWYHHDVSARQQHLSRLVACLRLTQFDVDFLLTHIQSLPGCELLALQAYQWISNPSARTKINMRFTEPRVGIGAEKTLLAVYGMNNVKDPCVLQYNKAEDKWQKYASINIDCMNYNPLLKDDNLLFIGGGGLSLSKKFLSWNIPNKTWRKLPEMKQARTRNCVVELDGKVYAIGGYDDNNTLLQSVERYTESNGWESVAPLITARSEAGAVTFNGKIYIMGGCNFGYLKSVECYNPDSNSWSKCADMAYEHRWPSVAVHNGHIYVAGHLNGPVVERYDPQRDSWSQICALKNNSFGDYCCASLDNKLWAIGGRVEEGRTEVAVYDEANNDWVQKSPLPKGSIYSCFAVSLSLLTSK